VVDWRDPITKKRAIESVEEDTREAAKRRLAEILKTGEQVGSKATFKEYGDWWLENCAKAQIKHSTFEEYRAVLNKHLYPLFGSRPLVKISRAMVRELIAAKQKEKLSQSTIRNILAPMRGMYNQAIEDGEAHANPAARVGKFNKRSGSGKTINPLTREETQTLLVKARETVPAYYPLFLCAPRTGLREGELIALKGMDVDFKGKFIDVQRNISRGKVSTPKNGKSRRVDMSSQLVEVLQAMLSQKRSAALQAEMKKPVGERRDAATIVSELMEDWLFTTPKGARLEPSNLRKVFNKLLTAAELRRVCFHDLRHTFATLLIGQGESLAYVRDQLGHHSIQITVDTYGHLVPGGNRQAVDRLDEVVISETAVSDQSATA
jgi:integrase